jgi:UDP-N-acetyl-L-fucosamine synthase
MNAFCVLSDSGTLSEESAILGFTGILIRTSTEHPEVLDRGSIIIGGIKSEDIRQAVEAGVVNRVTQEENFLPTDYKDDNVSVKVVKIIQSFTKIVNMTIWGKD